MLDVGGISDSGAHSSEESRQGVHGFGASQVVVVVGVDGEAPELAAPLLGDREASDVGSVRGCGGGAEEESVCGAVCRATVRARRSTSSIARSANPGTPTGTH
jgi:hypothetical protein